MLAARILLGVSSGLAAAQAQSADPPVRIGVLTDLSGLFSDQGGQGAVVAAKLAAEDSRLRLVVGSRYRIRRPIRTTRKPARRSRKWIDQVA